MRRDKRYFKEQYINRDGLLSNCWILKSERKIVGPGQSVKRDKDEEVYYLRTQVVGRPWSPTTHVKFTSLLDAFAYQQRMLDRASKNKPAEVVSTTRARGQY